MERLDKILSNLGYGSRKELKGIIKRGVVQVDGVVVKDNGKIIDIEKSIVKINGEQIVYRKFIYLIMNKPDGVISATRDNREETVIDLLHPDHQAFDPFPVGRLDKDTVGLLLLTNDGELANKILEADNGHEKEYIVTLNKPYDDKFLEDMARGVEIGDEKTRPSTLEKISEDTFSIILTQGLNRQIRRMSKTLGYNVVRLQRIRIMNIKLEGLIYGKWRDLTEDELRELRNLCYII